MTEIKPWEEEPDEAYWQATLDKSKNNALVQETATAPPNSDGWSRAEQSYARGEALELPVVAHNRGGLLVDFGDLRGFVPASQLSTFPRQTSEEERAQALASYVGTKLRVQVIEFDRAHNRLILSERIANPLPSRADQVLAAIQAGQTCRGTIRNVTNFGAFIDLGGVEGLVHVSELAWQYVAHPRQVVQPGQELDVYVMQVDRDLKKIACSIKRLQPNPWSEIALKLHPGDWTDGRVTSVVAFGAFVQIIDGVEGLLHISEFANPSSHTALQEGQPVRVRVMEIDPAQQRMKLSLRDPNAKGNGSNRSEPANAAAAASPPPLDPGYWENLAQSG